MLPPPYVIPIAFADDVAFVVSGDTRRQIEMLRNQTMSILANRNENVHFEPKIKVGRAQRQRGSQAPSDYIQGYIRIMKVVAATYLGVEIDSLPDSLSSRMSRNKALRLEPCLGKLDAC